MECSGMQWNAKDGDGMQWNAMECDGVQANAMDGNGMFRHGDLPAGAHRTRSAQFINLEVITCLETNSLFRISQSEIMPFFASSNASFVQA